MAETKTLSRRAVLDVLSAADDPTEYAAVVLAYFVTLTADEMAGLVWHDLSVVRAQGRLHVRTPPNRRLVRVPKHVMDALKEIKKDARPEDPVFSISKVGQVVPMTARTIDRLVGVVMGRIGIDASTQTLRDTHIRHAMELEAELKAVNEAHRVALATIRRNRSLLAEVRTARMLMPKDYD